MNVHPVTPAIGAEISNIELTAPLEQTTCDRIYQLLIEHQVIFLRTQRVSPEQHLALARTFGEPKEVHPVYPHVEGFSNLVLIKNGPDNPPDTNDWHTDLTFRQDPPFASVLSAKMYLNLEEILCGCPCHEHMRQ